MTTSQSYVFLYHNYILHWQKCTLSDLNRYINRIQVFCNNNKLWPGIYGIRKLHNAKWIIYIVTIITACHIFMLQNWFCRFYKHSLSLIWFVLLLLNKNTYHIENSHTEACTCVYLRLMLWQCQPALKLFMHAMLPLKNRISNGIFSSRIETIPADNKFKWRYKGIKIYTDNAVWQWILLNTHMHPVH